VQKHIMSVVAVLPAVLWGYAQTVQLPLKEGALAFAVIGDSGSGTKAQYQVADQMAAAHRMFPFNFVLMLGDNLYGGDNPRDFERKFARPYMALLDRGVEFYAALGNHDDPGRQILYDDFNMGEKTYYSFKPRSDVHFFALNSSYMDRRQLEWLEKELSSSDSPWKIVFFHHPLYSSGRTHGPNIELRTVLEPLLVKHGVDVVFTGHEHFYERTPAKNGIHYFIVGSSGKLREGNIRASGVDGTGFDQDNAFLIAEISGDEMLFQVISRTGNTVDVGSIRRVEE
jgi:Calcineurin-like phosphoesterase